MAGNAGINFDCPLTGWEGICVLQPAQAHWCLHTLLMNSGRRIYTTTLSTQLLIDFEIEAIFQSSLWGNKVIFSNICDQTY